MKKKKVACNKEETKCVRIVPQKIVRKISFGRLSRFVINFSKSKLTKKSALNSIRA